MDSFNPPTWERSYANLPSKTVQAGTGETSAATTAAAAPVAASATTASASAAGGTQSVTETYNTLTKEIGQLQERHKTLEQQVKEAERMASYGSTGGSGLYRSVLETLEAALAQTDDAIKAKTEQRNAAVLAPLDTITAGGETELPPTLVDMITDYLQNPAGTAEDTRDAYIRAYEKPDDGEDESYLRRSIDQMLLGNYSDDVTALGTLGQIALGLTGLDTAADLRDLTYDLTHWDGSLAHAGQTLLDVVGLIPGIGALKNADEVAYLIKSALNAAPALADAGKYGLKSGGLLAGALQSLFKSSDELTAAGKAAGKAGAETSEEIARAYAKTAEDLGLGTAESGGAAQKYIDKAVNAQNKYADKGVDAMKGNAGEAAGAAGNDGSETLSKQLLDAWDESEEAIEGAGDVGQYTQKIKWGIQDVDVRPAGKGFFGQRTQQINPRVDAYELKINPNNESYYLKFPSGGYVQYENMINDVVMDGKLVIQQKSFYHVNDLPEFARNKVLQEATRQVEAANNVGYTVEWLVFDPKAVAQLTDFFKSKNINIVVKYLPE